MVTYIQHPPGYPATDFRVRRAGSRWAVDCDVWHTPTSHDGWRECQRYRTRSAATAAMNKATARLEQPAEIDQAEDC